MEENDEFERRAFDAAGPVFLVAMGVLLLLVLAFSALAVPLGSPVPLALLALGGASLAAGLLWGARRGRDAGDGG